MKNNISISDEELIIIEQFLTGKLAGQDLEAFQEKLSVDTGWQKKVEWVKLTILGIKEVALSEELKKVKLNHSTAIIRNISRKRIALIASLSAVAISLSVVFLSIWASGVFKKSNEKLFAKFYTPDSGLMTAMGVTDSYDFDVAMINYKSGEYEKAIKAWGSLREGHESNDTLNYFIGSSYLALNQAPQAVSYFEKVLEKKDGVFFYDTQWYLGLALIKSGKEKEAIPHITLSKNPLKEELLKRLR